MIYVLLALGVAIVYFVVYRFSKLFGMSNSTTVLIDTTYESVKERRFKVPIWRLTIDGIRTVAYGTVIILVLGGIIMAAVFVVSILKG
jgi:hypothetical protein